MSDAAHWMAPGRSRVSTFLVCRHAREVVDFAKSVFGATEIRPPLDRADGSLWNAELAIGDSTVMLGEATDQMERPGFLYVHVPDADAAFETAKAHGAEVIMPPAEQFYGDYDGGVQDMGGNWWWIATHRTDLTDAEIEANARRQEQRR